MEETSPFSARTKEGSALLTPLGGRSRWLLFRRADREGVLALVGDPSV